MVKTLKSFRSATDDDTSTVLQSGTEEADNMDDILQLMDRVKSKRERLKKIGQTNRDATCTRRSESCNSSNGSSTSPEASTPKRLQKIDPQKSRIRRDERARLRTIQGIFQDTSRHTNNDDDENDTKIEEGEFVDEDLSYDPATATKKEKKDRKHLWVNRLLALGILLVTIMVVMVLVAGMKKAERQGANVQVDELSPTQEPTTFDIGGGLGAKNNDTGIPNETAGWEVSCFETTEELEDAVHEYLKNPTPNSFVSEKYGYPIGTWCVSRLKHFKNVFSSRGKELSHLYKEFNEPLDGWDVSSAQNMQSMFSGASAFNQPLEWNVSGVKDFRGMFAGCESFNQNLSSWNVTHAQQFAAMFEGASSFEGWGLENWKLGPAVKLDDMFQNAVKFNAPIGVWDMTGVTSMSHMLNGAHSFNQDLHEWRFSPKLEWISALFQDCQNFNGRVDGWNLEETEIFSLERVFSGASSFNQPLDSWDVSKIEKFHRLFAGATSFTHELSTWQTTFAYSFEEMFYGATSFNSDISFWDMSGAEVLAGMFRGATSFNQPIGEWQLTKASDMSFMFADTASFNQDLNWNVSTVNTMTAMFQNAQSFNGDVTMWNVSHVQSMDLMFAGATAFNQPIGGWSLSSVTQIGGILAQASNFDQDLCDWSLSLNVHLPNSTAENMTDDSSLLVKLFDSTHASVPYENKLFDGSACAQPSDPVYSDGRFLGPFCHACSVR